MDHTFVQYSFFINGQGRTFNKEQVRDEQLEVYKQLIEIYTISPNGKSNNVININYEDFTSSKIKNIKKIMKY